ncbi:ribosome-associated heat shock protein Hsp15 [Sinobacterium caligoides]|uniref:Heat shock protein 15 n=1 Tax=Sinobacterium caligoides TaxID=933926 RepID=A0A3N2DGF6_9GAMM|nr:S4 domain-containing protein [Sinobacterium caligoides]ROR98880.1 ribosome-associated heat shock protein Hsp15 [Sinobacterium caligoides]
MTTENKKVRLDKWLWAARFFKTRSIAKQAIDGGKVHFDGARCKVSKEVVIGAKLTIRQGSEEKTVLIKQLSDQRRGYEVAKELYEELPESIAKREQTAAQRRAEFAGQLHSERRPSKRDRRRITTFKDAMNQEVE